MKDTNVYNERMARSINYKKFWFDRIDPSKIKYIIDFGCGDGTLLKEVANTPKFKHCKLIGYDISRRQIEKAQQNCEGLSIDFYSRDYSQLYDIIPADEREQVAIVFSSVLHEWFTYNNNNAWRHVLPIIYITRYSKYIIIRDMEFTEKQEYLMMAKYKKSTYRKVLAKKTPQLLSFLKHGWNIQEKPAKNVTHFLLKYQYKENWDTEVKENYFATPFDKIISEMGVNGFSIRYLNRYSMPYLEQQIEKDFDIKEFPFNTHTELILERTGI